MQTIPLTDVLAMSEEVLRSHVQGKGYDGKVLFEDLLGSSIPVRLRTSLASRSTRSL